MNFDPTKAIEDVQKLVAARTRLRNPMREAVAQQDTAYVANQATANS